MVPELLLNPGAPTGGHELLQHPVIREMANRHGKSAAQVVLRWHLQMGGAAVAKSTRAGRIEDNYRVWDFQLTPAEMAAIADLNHGWRHLLWAETSAHADYPFKDWLPHDYVTQKPGKGATAGAKE